MDGATSKNSPYKLLWYSRRCASDGAATRRALARGVAFIGLDQVGRRARAIDGVLRAATRLRQRHREERIQLAG